jgi:extracellular elastinolytic metalloproteinase
MRKTISHRRVFIKDPGREGLNLRPSSVSRRLGAAAAGTLLLAGVASAPAYAAPKPARAATGHEPQRRADYDSRETLGTATTAAPAASLRALTTDTTSNTSAVKALHDQLGVQGIVDIDRSTGTPRRVAKLDGFLTGPSRKKPVSVALDYVAAHPEIFFLDKKGVAGLELRQDYVDIEGTHHLSFIQSVGGVPVFGNGLKAHVTKDGRLLQIDGAPLKSLPAAASSPAITATTARSEAVKDVFGTSSARVTKVATGVTRTTSFSDGGNAQLVYFNTDAGPRLAWQTISVDEGYQHVIDAATGQVLYRRSTVASDTGDAFPNYPGAPKGGTQRTVDLRRWLPENAPVLSGNIAHVYSDVNDDNVANPTEEIPTQGGRRDFQYPFTDFTSTVGGRCSPAFKCSWDPATPNSWQVNRKQNAVQMMYFVGTWHDHLKSAPIGFTRAAGNFEAVDGDALQAQSDDGANTANGLPDINHVDNANMNTPPDGIPPTMQMYLFLPDDLFLAGNSGDESGVVYHEYTHGLSNRLVVDANGNSTLGDVQAGAMGEAWGDWYGSDYLVDQGLEKDTKTIGDVRVGKYVTAGDTIRTEPLDCTVGAPATVCPGTPGAGPGGYTYGDFGKVIGGPEVHADGEIWAQTLWDLRKAVGSRKAQSLVTRAMELSPSNPSFLDERNSILAADLVVDGGKLQKTIWSVFAKRGMGYFAASVDGDDSQPVEDFSMPPAANTPRGSLTGKVTDQDTGAAVVGLTVGFGGHASGFASDYVGITQADGTYKINGILPGTYAKVFARGAGYDTVTKTLRIRSHVTLRTDWQVRRDWAASGGGGSVVSATGPDYTPFGCGPAKLIDQSQVSGWGSDVAAAGQTIVLKLSGAVDISDLVINPSATCGDDPTSSASGYRVETSADGTTWTLAASGAFPTGTVTATSVALTAGTGDGVGFVRYTMLNTQGQAAGLCPAGEPPTVSGCVFLDSTELSVYGPAAG